LVKWLDDIQECRRMEIYTTEYRAAQNRELWTEDISGHHQALSP